jgi:hypothetical protein
MRRKIFLILGIAAGIYSAFASDTTTVTLQNGTQGYSGCEDTYNHCQYPTENNSESLNFLTWNCLP